MPEAPLVTSKPLYRVPSMAEIRAIPWNGFKVASTFSGCGGSSLGYRMAGFRVLWASEFVEAARDCYRANMAEGTILDGRDIRAVAPADILAVTGLAEGELDLLDGSPPCASFSTAGKRQAGWGQVKPYSDTSQRTDDLFFEFARILRGLQPKVFVAENVYGLVKGTAKGFFLEILAALKACGYRVESRLLDAQWLGVPQMRQRLIFIGVRQDLPSKPAYPAPLPYRYSVRDALPNIRRHGTAPPHAVYVAANRQQETTFVDSAAEPCPTITVGENKGTGWVEDFPPGRRVIHDTWGQGDPQRNNPWSAGDITDRPAPPITVGVGERNTTHFQVEMSHISAACVVHPTEKRKFTIAELRRICGFPDDFVLLGSYSQQWERLGRAVPPLMMRAIAETVRDRILTAQAQ